MTNNSIRVYSRTVEDDGHTLTAYTYNGSFQFFGSLLATTDADKESWAKMLDCFFDVLFVRDGDIAVAYRMADYR